MRERDTSGSVPIPDQFTSSKASLNEEEGTDGMLGSSDKNSLHPRETATPRHLKTHDKEFQESCSPARPGVGLGHAPLPFVFL